MKQKKSTLLAKRDRAGYFFCAHWIIGLAVFFVFPLVSSIFYSFSEVNIGAKGLSLKFVAFENYIEIFKRNPTYVNNLRDSVVGMLTDLPIIVCLSLFLALILNSKFKGRLLFRGIFFLPVIIANSVVMETLKNPQVGMQLFTNATGAQATTYGGMIDFNSMLLQLNMPDALTKLFADYLSNVFGLIWSCGVQTILFMAGLQSISAQLYEVGKIEGANRWEILWFMEVPMLRNVILLVLFYTMIDQFTAMSTPVMAQLSSVMFKSQSHDISSAMLWAYFLIAGAVMGIILWAYNKFLMKKWE